MRINQYLETILAIQIDDKDSPVTISTFSISIALSQGIQIPKFIKIDKQAGGTLFSKIFRFQKIFKIFLMFMLIIRSHETWVKFVFKSLSDYEDQTI